MNAYRPAISLIASLALALGYLGELTWAQPLPPPPDPLEQVRRATDYGTSSVAGRAENWVNPNTEYGQLFVDQMRAQELVKWCAPVKLEGWRFGADLRIGAAEWVGAQRIFYPRRGIPIELTIAVPHPRFLSQLEFNLVNEFARIRPPFLKVKSETPFLFGDTKAVAYQHLDGNCSLVLEGAKQSVIRLVMQRCPSTDALVELGKLLNMDRFNAKLNS